MNPPAENALLFYGGGHFNFGIIPQDPKAMYICVDMKVILRVRCEKRIRAILKVSDFSFFALVWVPPHEDYVGLIGMGL